jgi:hypothetical protein
MRIRTLAARAFFYPESVAKEVETIDANATALMALDLVFQAPTVYDFVAKRAWQIAPLSAPGVPAGLAPEAAIVKTLSRQLAELSFRQPRRHGQGVFRCSGHTGSSAVAVGHELGASAKAWQKQEDGDVNFAGGPREIISPAAPRQGQRGCGVAVSL